MTKLAVILDLPDTVYEQIKQRAEQMNRSLEAEIEAEIVEVVSKAMPDEEKLPPELAEAVTDLAFLDDKVLWRLARSQLAKKDAARIERLHHKRSDGLSEAEEQELQSLMKKFSRIFVLHNAAIGLLIERGHDVSVLVQKNE